MGKLGAALAVSALLLGCSIVPATHNIKVTLDLSGDVVPTDSGCAGDGGYDDIKRGTQFTIKDPSGTLIGFGSLTATQYVDRLHCKFAGTAQDVPDAAIYSVEIGRRGVVNFTRAELEANAWTAALTLGDLNAKKPRARLTGWVRSAGQGCQPTDEGRGGRLFW